MRLGVSLYTIGVMCFLRIELLLVVTVYVYSCDVPYLVIYLICDGGYHMVSYTNIGNVMSSIYVCTSQRKVRVIEVLLLPKAVVSPHVVVSALPNLSFNSPPPPFSPDEYSDSPRLSPQCVCMYVCGGGGSTAPARASAGGPVDRWIGGGLAREV